MSAPVGRSNPFLRPTRRRPEPLVDDDAPSFVDHKRARQIRHQIEQHEAQVEVVGAPAHVTGCEREGCDGQFGKCYLPDRLCKRLPTVEQR